MTTASSFRTLTPSQTFQTQIFEGYDQTYGVGMPIMLTFSQPITNRAAVERSLQLTTSKPVVGAWYWDGSEHLDFRPQDYWPADTQVSFTGHLNGVEGARGVYAHRQPDPEFSIGPSVIAVASTAAHRTQIYYNGKLRYDWPISTGKASTATPNGTYLTIEKENPVRMIGGTPGTAGYYNELVPWSVRFTFSGDYYHDAPWSVGDQGYTNVSHGCVNLSPADAQTYYNLAVPGDPITITSSTEGRQLGRRLDRMVPQLAAVPAGQRAGKAVKAGPDGSTFVSPSSLPASTAPPRWRGRPRQITTPPRNARAAPGMPRGRHGIRGAPAGQRWPCHAVRRRRGPASRWCGRPHRCHGHGAPPPPFLAFCGVVLRVAAMAAPSPSRVTVTGLVRPKFWQFRLVNDIARRLAMKVNRLLPTPGPGRPSVASRAWSLARNSVCMLGMFWQ